VEKKSSASDGVAGSSTGNGVSSVADGANKSSCDSVAGWDGAAAGASVARGVIASGVAVGAGVDGSGDDGGNS
jgi:hypothetical protein